MDPIKIIWQSYHKPEILSRGYWDNGLLEDLFKRGNFEHVDGFENLSPDSQQGAIVIINGRTHIEDVEKINEDINGLRWCLLLITGDEEALFPWQDIKHPLLRTWVMLPRMNQHNDVSFKMPNGYRLGAHDMLKEIGLQEHKRDWFFVGQVNHERREQCVQELTYLIDSNTNPNGTLVKTERFGEEKLNFKDYLTLMADSKVVLCPSGIESPDNFRLYEALESGAMPVVDAFSTNNKSTGFWSYLFGHGIPFPIVDYWDKLIPLLPELLRDYPRNANQTYAWWQLFKRNMFFKLIDDIKEISK